MKKKVRFDILIPFIIAALFSLFNLLDVYRRAENRVYDLLLHIRPTVPENESLLFIESNEFYREA